MVFCDHVTYWLFHLHTSYSRLGVQWFHIYKCGSHCGLCRNDIWLVTSPWLDINAYDWLLWNEVYTLRRNDFPGNFVILTIFRIYLEKRKCIIYDHIWLHMIKKGFVSCRLYKMSFKSFWNDSERLYLWNLTLIYLYFQSDGLIR